MSKVGNFWKNSTAFTKVLIVAVILGGLFFGYKKLRSNGTISNKQLSSVKVSTNPDADLVIAYNTFPGMEGILYMNGGMEPNEDSRLFKKYGIKVQIKKMDVVADTREALKSDQIDAAYCTVDALSVEMGSGSDLLADKVKLRLKINESRGADAIVVTKGINTVQDLKGKTVAYAQATASNTLLINVLESAGLSIKDIQPKKVSDGVEAADAFRAGSVDAAVVWAPDDEDCAKAVAGSKILVSTKTASQIIADGLLIKDDTYQKKHDQFVKLAKAWLEGNAEMNTNTAAKKEANKLFAAGFDFPEDIAALSADKIRFSTAQDNKQFFGLDATFTGVTGEKMYSRMAVKYTDLDLAKAPAAWRNVADESLVEEVLGDNALVSNPNQSSEGQTKFAAATEKDKTVAAQSSKTVTVNFPTNSFTLDDNSKTIIDREVTGLAQAFKDARIRVEGNTDNTGNPAANRALSLRRAQAVIDYLVSEYKFDRNKFIPVGNGPDKPVADNNTEDGKAANRRTDFQFIW